jgi:hypothetical protein
MNSLSSAGWPRAHGVGSRSGTDAPRVLRRSDHLSGAVPFSTRQRWPGSARTGNTRTGEWPYPAMSAARDAMHLRMPGLPGSVCSFPQQPNLAPVNPKASRSTCSRESCCHGGVTSIGLSLTRNCMGVPRFGHARHRRLHRDKGIEQTRQVPTSTAGGSVSEQRAHRHGNLRSAEGLAGPDPTSGFPPMPPFIN